MKLAKYRHPNGSLGVGRIEDFSVTPLNLSGGQFNCLADILEADDPLEVTDFLSDATAKVSLGKVKLLPPIDRQEVWAAGATYRKSQKARMEGSTDSSSCYERVYKSPRPELFFKATAHRVVGPGQPVRIRRDSKWCVPEPQLALVMNSHLHLVGFTIGNDMSSRDIESENPLYLPQARIYDGGCSLGPCITLTTGMPSYAEIEIAMLVRRSNEIVCEGKTSIGQMARSFDHLIDWLVRENSFPFGAFLLTGTGIVPEKEFALQPDDSVEITITGVGTLLNPVVQG